MPTKQPPAGAHSNERHAPSSEGLEIASTVATIKVRDCGWGHEDDFVLVQDHSFSGWRPPSPELNDNAPARDLLPDGLKPNDPVVRHILKLAGMTLKTLDLQKLEDWLLETYSQQNMAVGAIVANMGRPKRSPKNVERKLVRFARWP
jgi:hypothetical protein